MSSSRLGGYRRTIDEHPGAENYPAGTASSPADVRDTENFRAPRISREYSGIGGSERSSYPPEYTPDYKANLDSDLDASYGSAYDADRHDADPADYDADYDEWDDYDEPDGRWRWVAAAAAAILVVAVLIIMMVGGGDDSQTAATTDEPTAPRTVIATEPSATASRTTAPSPTATLPPETVTTVTPAPAEPSPAAPPVEEAAPAGPLPGTITYTVTGNRQLFDLVSIIYTDEQGLPRTDVNVALPWSRTVVLNPGVTNMSVTATSLTGQLNCVITDDVAGAVLVEQANNVMISTCTK